MSRLTLLQETVLQLATVIQFESGFVLSVEGVLFTQASASHRLALSSSSCFRYDSLSHARASRRARYNSY
ncbi:hypothetical protein J6T66_05835 [bacterium]|nr:hypothetical protein [bacterium]